METIDTTCVSCGNTFAIAEIAWMAGLFDGEGCISFNHANAVRLMVSMTDLDLLERLQSVAGYGNIHISKQPSKPGAKTLYKWEIGERHHVERLLRAMLPWFGERRKAKALEAIERLKGNYGPGTNQYSGKERN